VGARRKGERSAELHLDLPFLPWRDYVCYDVMMMMTLLRMLEYAKS